VATTATNVGSVSCQVTDGISIINLAVLDCTPALATDLISFNGLLADNKGRLSWTTTREEHTVSFTVERSIDGLSFSTAGIVNGNNHPGRSTNSYEFTDPVDVTGKVFYRVVMIDENNKKKFTRVIQLSKAVITGQILTNVINPFYQSLEFDIDVTADTKIETELIDMFGKVVKRSTYLVHRGVNTLSIMNTDYLPAGAYVFRLCCNGAIYSKKVLKRNNP
jgi:hypothetical protein